MDLKDEYHLTAERWSSAMLIWAFKKCPESGPEYDAMQRLDEKLKRLAHKYVRAYTDF